MIRLKKMTWVRHVAHMWEIRNECRALVGITEGRDHLEILT
jgi:hypothetical protein